jgi:hypothetical protein
MSQPRPTAQSRPSAADQLRQADEAVAMLAERLRAAPERLSERDLDDLLTAWAD